MLFLVFFSYCFYHCLHVVAKVRLQQCNHLSETGFYKFQPIYITKKYYFRVALRNFSFIILKSLVMNKLLSLLFFLFCYCHLHAQKIDSAAMARLSPAERLKVDSLHKVEKGAKTGAFLTMGLGIAAGAGGLAIYAHAMEEDLLDASPAGLILCLAGVGVALLSIPQFRKAHKAGREAKAIVYGEKGASLAPGIMMPHTQSAGLKLVIPLGR